MAAAVIIAVTVAAVSLVAIARVEWPAYNSSNQLHALTTVGQFACLAGLFACGLVWRRGRRVLARLATLLFLSAFSVVTLAMPLGATKLYLFGISVDQQFRTEYLTRLADSPALHDMTYHRAAAVLPARLVLDRRPAWPTLTGTPAWEMFKPWAIISITVAIALAFVLWAAMIRFEYALVVTTATAAATLAYSPAEPYAAIITVLLPPVFVLAWSGLRGGSRNGGWAAVIGDGGVPRRRRAVLLAAARLRRVHAGDHGVACSAVAAPRRRRAAAETARHRGDLGGDVADRSRARGCWPRSGARPPDSGTAQHYLPAAGASLEFPMLRFTLLGALCMLGTLWLVWRARSSTRAGALAVAVLAVYAWSLLSMLTTLARHHAAVVPAATDPDGAAGGGGRLRLHRGHPGDRAPVSSQTTGRRVVAAAATLGAIGALTFSQDIPDVLRSDIVVAYTDTDGYGQRADRRPPGAERYYREIDARIGEVTGRPRNETVVLTADYSFLSYYPYYGFQGLTSHYANPLAQFEKRADAIEGWATLTDADQFIESLDALPWEAPTCS